MHLKPHLSCAGFLAGLLALTPALAADHAKGKGPRVAPATDPLYLKECGSCHFAYQPGLLPARSWDRLMNNLADHFGENAELPPAETRIIHQYLLAGAAGSSPRARAYLARLGADPEPLRISATDYFRREHRELAPAQVSANPEVKSFSNCGACHQDASQGRYQERAIRIPGFGPWKD